MARGDLEKRVTLLESQISRPQEPVDVIIVDESDYLEKKAIILQAEEEGRFIIVICGIDGRKKAEPTGGYADFLKRREKSDKT